MREPTPGERAHDAFVAARPYGASPPAGRPRWSDLTPDQQQAWEAAAQAVQPPPGTWSTLQALDALREGARAVVRHWHAGGPADGLADAVHVLEHWLAVHAEDVTW